MEETESEKESEGNDGDYNHGFYPHGERIGDENGEKFIITLV